MPDEPRPPTLDKELTTKIVAAYVRTTQLPVLISTVHQALSGLGKPVAEFDRARIPAVPIQ
jgi:predicted transcriptional regulator